jgi:hypothetical protein
VALLRRLAAGILIALFVLLAGVQTRALAAPTATATDSEVKAAFLCGFAEFVDWPSLGQDETVTIGILGKDPFGSLLEETVKNRALRNRKLVVRRVSTLEEAARCQIVFVSNSEAQKVDDVLRFLGKGSILTVSDIDGFAERGGVIGFAVEDKRVRFHVNVASAEQARLQISSRLLKLGRLVTTETKSGSRG